MKAEFYKVRGTELEEMIKRGNKVLKSRYREWWVRFWYGVGALTCTLLFFWTIQLMSWLSDLINYVFK